jgi:glyoxylase-like metal-dependent hydrolase (beta-lactamase superfamily II)
MSEGTHETPPTEEVRPGLWSIPLPVPGPLGFVLVYALLLENGGVLLIDAGWDSRAQWDALERGLGLAGRRLEQVVGLVATHSHADHYASAARLREASGAWVALHRDDAPPGSPDDRAARAEEGRWVQDWGLSGREGAAVGEALEQMRRFAPVTVPDVLLRDGDRIDAPGWDLRVVHTPGHSPGHVCIVEPRHEVAFTGDHILARTTPNISLGPVSGPDPLGDYQSSLERMRSSYGTFEALPGHEERVQVGARAGELLAHHEEQLGLALELVRGRDATARDVAAAMPWLRSWESFGGLDLCMAVAETHAHLVRLEVGGLIEQVGTDPLRWRAAA